MRTWINKKRASRSNLKKVISNVSITAKNKEAKRLGKLHSSQLQALAEKKDLERILQVTELETEVIRLQDLLDSDRLKIRQANKLYYETLQMAKVNTKISAELTHNHNRVWLNFIRYIDKYDFL